MNDSVQGYKIKIQNMQQRILELEEVNTKLVNEKSAWHDLKGDVSFRDGAKIGRPEVQVEVVNDSIRCLEDENRKLR